MFKTSPIGFSSDIDYFNVPLKSLHFFLTRVEDSTFLNELQKGVTRWIREMQKVTRLDPDPSTGSTMQEIGFWHNMDRALQALKAQRDSPEVVLTLEVLKLGKRFHATVGYVPPMVFYS